MAHHAGLNAGFRPFLIEFFLDSHEVLGSTLQRFGVQIFEMRRESRQHCGAESIRHCEHELALAPALDEGKREIRQAALERAKLDASRAEIEQIWIAPDTLNRIRDYVARTLRK